MKRAVLGHTKFKKLTHLMGIPDYQAVGILEMLWQLTARQAPAGDLGRIPDDEIAIFLGWPGDVAPLLDTLTHVGFIDAHKEHRFVVHDWSEHCEDAVHAQLARARCTFADGTIPRTSKLGREERAKVTEELAKLSSRNRRNTAAGGGRRRNTAAGGGRKEPASASASASALIKEEEHTHTQPAMPFGNPLAGLTPESFGEPGPALTACPTDFAPDAKAVVFCDANDLDLETERTKFVNNARSNARISADWDAAFSNWLIESRNRRSAVRPVSGQRASPTFETAGEKSMSAVRRVAEKMRAEGHDL